MRSASRKPLGDGTTTIIMINGLFAVGKTTAARALIARLEHATVFDPERIGWVLQRLPSWIRLRGRRTGDFQDLESWRTLTVRGVALVRRMRRGPIVVPMTIVDPDYLWEIRDGLSAIDHQVFHFCLTATLDTLRERSRRRGDPADGFAVRRARACIHLLDEARFAERIPTDHLTPAQVVERILRRLP